MKKLLTLGVIGAALMLPNTAQAGCVHMHGNFEVSCENGVKVYRNQMPDLANVGPNAVQAKLQIAQMKQETARRKIAAERAAARGQYALAQKVLDNQRYASRLAYNHGHHGRSYRSYGGYGYGAYGLGGYGYGYGLGGGSDFGRRGRNISGVERINRRHSRINIPGVQDGNGRRGSMSGNMGGHMRGGSGRQSSGASSQAPATKPVRMSRVSAAPKASGGKKY